MGSGWITNRSRTAFCFSKWSISHTPRRIDCLLEIRPQAIVQNRFHCADKLQKHRCKTICTWITCVGWKLILCHSDADFQLHTGGQADLIICAVPPWGGQQGRTGPARNRTAYSRCLRPEAQTAEGVSAVYLRNFPVLMLPGARCALIGKTQMADRRYHWGMSLWQQLWYNRVCQPILSVKRQGIRVQKTIL